ncbi:hypothetical protein DW2_17437 [Thioclava atlantica]|uniref:Uncharacterized protein n=1 Tax=Thioclava atlantica TaxID=1317124 RepID=A0A085TRY5_9RHOB|nr:hypothetical protein DW2_17437 [Thioclava atlantica]
MSEQVRCRENGIRRSISSIRDLLFLRYLFFLSDQIFARIPQAPFLGIEFARSSHIRFSLRGVFSAQNFVALLLFVDCGAIRCNLRELFIAELEKTVSGTFETFRRLACFPSLRSPALIHCVLFTSRHSATIFCA